MGIYDFSINFISKRKRHSNKKPSVVYVDNTDNSINTSESFREKKVNDVKNSISNYQDIDSKRNNVVDNRYLNDWKVLSEHNNGSNAAFSRNDDNTNNISFRTNKSKYGDERDINDILINDQSIVDHEIGHSRDPYREDRIYPKKFTKLNNKRYPYIGDYIGKQSELFADKEATLAYLNKNGQNGKVRRRDIKNINKEDFNINFPSTYNGNKASVDRFLNTSGSVRNQKRILNYTQNDSKYNRFVNNKDKAKKYQEKHNTFRDFEEKQKKISEKIDKLSQKYQFGLYEAPEEYLKNKNKTRRKENKVNLLIGKYKLEY